MPTPLDRLDLSRTPWATRSELQALVQEHARELTRDTIQEPPAIPARLIPPGHLYAITDPEPATREDIAGVWAYSPTPQGAMEEPTYRPTLWEHLEEG